MSDEQQPPPKANARANTGIKDFNIGGPDFTLQEQVEIGADAVSHWTSIPPETPVVLRLTRGDFDRLYFAITQMNAATTMLAETVRLMSFGDNAAALATFEKARQMANSGDGNFRQFFAAVMKGAAPNG
jgi:hypothetical protein